MPPIRCHPGGLWCGRHGRASPFALVRPSGVLPPS
jgi:hypothetical protein